MALLYTASRLRLTSPPPTWAVHISSILHSHTSSQAFSKWPSQIVLQRRCQTQLRQLPSSMAPRGLQATPESTHRWIRRGFGILAILLSFATGYQLASQPTVQAFVAVVMQPSDGQSLDLFKPDPSSQSGQIESHLQALPLVRELSADPAWQASRPHLKVPANLRQQNFTAGHLLSENKLPIPPIVFTDGKGSKLVSVVYLGTAVCGHPGIVHGGLLATLMDEGLARTCFAALPNKVGVTANLNINYRAPCTAGRFVVLRAETVKVDGRKAWVKGRIETLATPTEPAKTLVEAEALFIEPKGFASQLMRLTP